MALAADGLDLGEDLAQRRGERLRRCAPLRVGEDPAEARHDVRVEVGGEA